MEQLRVVVVDDHPIYRCGLVGLLEAGGVAVAGVADGVEEAMAVVRATRPDAVLTDLYLSDGSGIELVKRVVAHDPRIRTVVLTVSHDRNEMLAAIRAGADGFLTKEQALSNMDNPDAEALLGDTLAPERNIERRLDALCKNTPYTAEFMPTPYMDLDLAKRLTVRRLNRLEADGEDPAKIERLIKFVVSTETISAGINLPAKRVVFPSLVKFIKKQPRLLSAADGALRTYAPGSFGERPGFSPS